MVQLSTLSPLEIGTTNSIKSILSTEEQSVKKNAPSFLQDHLNTLPSPSKLFQDYAATGNPMFKEAAGQARAHLLSAGESMKSDPLYYNRDEEIDSAVPDSVPSTLKEAIYSASKKYSDSSIQLLSQRLNKENKSSDPMAINHNSDGTQDLGLMQINSRMVPFITKEFAKMGRSFNWKNAQDSIEASALLDKENARVLKNYNVAPTPENLFTAYNVGPNTVFKASKGDSGATTSVDNYKKGSIFANE